MKKTEAGKIVLTYLELRTIIEDAFIDGWNTKDIDWLGPEDYLNLHKEYGDYCETTIALDGLREEEECQQQN